MSNEQTPRATRSFRGLTPEQRTRERYEKLIAAAVREFGERGYHATTVRDICRGAQLTERYFYESFPNLAALFKAVFERINQELKQATLAALTGAPREPLPLAEAGIRAYLEFLRAEPTRARVLLVESLATDRGVLGGAVSQRRMEFAVLLRGFTQFVFPWLASPTSQLRLDLVCNGLIGSTNFVAHDWVREDFATPLEQVLQSALALYHGVVLYARALEPKGKSAPEKKKARTKR